MMALDYGTDFLFTLTAYCAYSGAWIALEIIFSKAEAGKGPEECQVIVTGKCRVVSCDVNFIKQLYAEIFVELVYIGNRNSFALLVPLLHVLKITAI